MSETRTSSPAWPIALLVGGVVVMSLALTWTFLSMRSVMYVGGTCADGGPYVSAQPCPEGAGFIGIAIPLMILGTFAATVAAVRMAAPNLLVPMWTLLFGSLGWNFLEFAFKWPGGTDPGWLICGIVFELMAFPALLFILFTSGTMWTSNTGGSRPDPATSTMWWAAYLALGFVGVALGAWSFYSWR